MLNDLSKMLKFLTISDSMVFNPNISVINYENTILAKTETKEIKESIGVWSMSQLINILKVVEATKVEKDGEILKIYGNNGYQEYELSPVDLLEQYTASPDIFDRVKNAKMENTYSISLDDLKYIINISNLLSHQVAIFGNDITITTITGNNTFQNPNKKEVETKESNGKFVIETSSLAKLPIADYDVSFHRNNKGMVASIWKDIDTNDEFVIAIQKEL